MFSKQLLASLSLFVIFGAIHSDKDKSCIDAPPKKNFDPDEYYGHFYIYAYKDESRDNMDCLHYLISGDREGDAVPLVKLYREKSDNSTHMVLKNITIDSTGHGINSNKQPLTIVDTNYYHYLVTFACEESTDTRVVSMLLNKPNPGFTDTILPEAILRQYNISMNKDLKLMNHKGCPDDWSDAEIEEVDFTYEQIEAELIEYNILKVASN